MLSGKIIRGLYATHPGYANAWTDEENKAYEGAAEGQGPSICEILHYKKAQQPSCDNVGKSPVLRPTSGEPLFRALARLEIVARHPERQKAIFGWVTPAKNDFVGQTAFAIAKDRYWAGPSEILPTSVAESLFHLYGFKDTADFHANYLLRLLYLYGDTPSHLRTHRSSWRRFDRFNRDANLSERVESSIKKNLLAFKYWIDEPFFADERDDSSANLRQWRVAQKFKKDDIEAEMTFWSENHQILFATAEYLAGQLWPEAIFKVGNQFRSEGEGKTRASDLLGKQRTERAKPRILRWLNDRLRFGFSEWNGPGYYAEDFTALFNLADFCLDDDIQTRACMVLDLLIFDLTRFTHRGNFGASAGRCYFEHKICGYNQGVGDLVEVLFGTRGGVIAEEQSTCAGAFASSKRYQTPDVLIAIANDVPKEFIDRSRVSINFEEAGTYNVGFESDDDMMFWWSRAGWFTKWVIPATHKCAEKFHLLKTSPFKDVFSSLDKVVAFETGDTSRVLNFVNPLSAPTAPITAFLPTTNRQKGAALAALADKASVFTEGSALTRANLYTYRSANVMLSSVQNFRSGQLNFQGHFCQATLSVAASVWTSYPSAGDAFGIFKADDHNGPNWWTGSAVTPRVIQMKNAAIIGYKPKDLQYAIFGHRTHAWFPKEAFDEGSVIQRSGNCNWGSAIWTFGKVGDGYVGIFSAQTPVWTTAGPWTNKELVAVGPRNFFIIQVGSVTDFGSYGRFMDEVRNARIYVGGLRPITANDVASTVAGAFWGAQFGLVGGIVGGVLGSKSAAEKFECSYDIPGKGQLELRYDDNEVRYAGMKLSDDHYPRFENPFVKCGRVLWDQYNYTIKYAKHSLTHDFRAIQNIGTTAPVLRYLDSAESLEFDCSTGPRPFYVVGHNPNKISDVVAALDAGANAVEPDVNVYEDHQDQICISEVGTLDTDKGGDEEAPALGVFLDQLHHVALQRPELALVVFDCKPKVSTPELGARLLAEIRKRLTFDTELNIIISVSSLDHKAIFDKIKYGLGPREALMVDEENDPIAVSNFFTHAGVANQCYGNGVAAVFSAPTLSPHIRPSMEQACEARASAGRIKFIYVWSVSDLDKMREYIRIGVDGIIAGSHPSTFDAPTVAKLRAVSAEEEFAPLIRLATRGDYPFTPANSNYGLVVHTGGRFNAGTDAKVTFTLTGTLGSAVKVVDASLIGSIFGKTSGRMERDAWDHVTIQSPDLGELKSIAVQRDNEGNAPDWFLDQVQVRSKRYGVSKRAVFDRWIGTSPSTERLV
jgi:hypothetical protein